MTGSAARRAEAHLWLLSEQALLGIRRNDRDVAEVRREFAEVANALANAGIVDRAAAQRIQCEFDDVLAVRGLIPVASFRGVEPAPAAPVEPPSNAAAVWLEAEIERHLDLLAGFDPEVYSGAGAETIRLLGAPARAFEAAGVLGPAARLLPDLAASLAAAGYSTGVEDPDAVGEDRIRRQWVAFLERRPKPLPDHYEPEESRAPRVVAGQIGDRCLRISRLSWTADVLEVVVTVRGGELEIADLYEAWACRVVNERGGLHLGQPVPLHHDGGTAARFLLRPGLATSPQRLDIRITNGGRRVDAGVTL